MSAIQQQWTGKGLASGTAISSANVNSSGNGSTVTYSSTGTAEMLTEGFGFRLRNAEDSSLKRLDTVTNGRAVRLQLVITVHSLPSGTFPIVQLRNASARLSDVSIIPSGAVWLGGTTPNSPVFALGDRLLIDIVHTQHTTPTISNGRTFYRVRNLTNTAWNTAGEWFYDTGYANDLGVDVFTQSRFGKHASNTVAAPGFLYEFPGWEVIPVVNVNHTSRAQAEVYFADAPSVIGNPEGWRDPGVRVWNGSELVDGTVYVWNGSGLTPSQ